MKPFGIHLIKKHYSAKNRLYHHLFGKPWAWSKPGLVVRETAPSPGDLILDVGCRRGEYVAELAGRGAKTVGLDINPAIIGQEIPKGRPGAELTVGDALRLPFRSASFHKVILCDCLEHLEDDVLALREICRVLRPGGSLVLTVPTIPGYPPHRVFARAVSLLPDFLLFRGSADKGRTLEHTKSGGEDKEGFLLAHAGSEEILKAFGHYRHYDENVLTETLARAGLRLRRSYRFQMLFESEMIYYHNTVRGFQSPLLYPVMRLVSQLDHLLPRNYPGVGLLAVAER